MFKLLFYKFKLTRCPKLIIRELGDEDDDEDEEEFMALFSLFYELLPLELSVKSLLGKFIRDEVAWFIILMDGY